MEFENMTTRELVLVCINETRGVKKVVTEHIAYHAKQDDRRFKVHLALFVAAIMLSGTVITAFLC